MTMATAARVFGLLGDPVSHSRSPAMHDAAFARLGLPHRYFGFRVLADEIPAVLAGARAMGFGGLNVTVPHKGTVASVLDRLGPVAARTGSVNTVVFDEAGIRGHSTDGAGFLAALEELSPGRGSVRATLLGSGGAAVAIADALHHAFPALELRWVSRDAAGLSARLDPLGLDATRVEAIEYDQLDGAHGDLLINATSVGMKGGPEVFPAPIDLGGMESGSRVIDVVYPRPVGGLLDRAAARGLAVMDGLPMLLWQGVRALELWLARPLGDEVVAAMRAAIMDR